MPEKPIYPVHYIGRGTINFNLFFEKCSGEGFMNQDS